MKRINRICAVFSLLCYLFCLYVLCRLCQYGARARRFPFLIAGGLFFCLGLIGWLVSYLRIRRSEAVKAKKPAYFWCCLVIVFSATVYFGGRIVYSAIPYHGALSWKINEWRRTKQVVLEHDNVFEDGVDGFLKDLDRELSIPSELYTANKLQITFDGDGVVQTIYAFLYGEDDKGKSRNYLISYDRAASENMTVWLGGGGEASGNYEAGKRLEPMFVILQNAEAEDQIALWQENSDDGIYIVEYEGTRTFQTESGLQYLPGDVDGDGLQSGISNLAVMRNGGSVTGFAVTLSVKNAEERTSIYYIMEPEYTSLQEIVKDLEMQQIEKAKDAEGWVISQTDGTMHFFLDEQTGWRLVVIDAAAGSRLYALEKTKNGGSSWSVINKDPFDGSGGVAEGLIFYDEDFGYAGLASPSQNYSQLYVTRDGGLNFEKVELPVDTVTELPEDVRSLGFTSADYDYYEIPEQAGDDLFIKVTMQQGEKNGLLFKSEDRGINWTFCPEE